MPKIFKIKLLYTMQSRSIGEIHFSFLTNAMPFIDEQKYNKFSGWKQQSYYWQQMLIHLLKVKMVMMPCR